MYNKFWTYYTHLHMGSLRNSIYTCGYGYAMSFNVYIHCSLRCLLDWLCEKVQWIVVSHALSVCLSHFFTVLSQKSSVYKNIGRWILYSQPHVFVFCYENRHTRQHTMCLFVYVHTSRGYYFTHRHIHHTANTWQQNAIQCNII